MTVVLFHIDSVALYLKLIHNFAVTNPELNAYQKTELHQTVKHIQDQFERELAIFHAKAFPTLDAIGQENLKGVEKECREIFAKLDDFLIDSVAKKSAVIHTRPLFRYNDNGTIDLTPKKSRSDRNTWAEEDDRLDLEARRLASKKTPSERPKTAGSTGAGSPESTQADSKRKNPRRERDPTVEYHQRLTDHYFPGPSTRPRSVGGGGLSQNALTISELKTVTSSLPSSKKR